VTPDVTLLICTRDRAGSLAATLASVTRAAAAAPRVAVDAVLVDNGSADATPALIRDWAAAQPFRVALVHEPRPGLARARNAGLAHARGRVVAMTDDDCVLRPDYLARLADAFGDAAVPLVVGGRVLPGDAADLLLTVKLEDHPMEAPPRGFPGGFVMGANLAVTASALATIGPFDEQFGAGARFRSAEDTDFLYRALGAGVPVRYDPGFAVEHHHGRRCRREARRLLAGYGYGDGALIAKHLFADGRAGAAAARSVLDAIRERPGAATPLAEIPRFALFRLRHRAAGFLAYAAHRARRSGAERPAGGSDAVARPRSGGAPA